ncbi:MAG: acyltransferase family protein [Chloroflexi bacterium]|nr:acyltransferase family protein [Chloroflexota bacterium]
MRLPYLSGLDGLRAISVSAVLLYHADLSWVQGGFLGVEVFFVISGYLITALLLKEWNQEGRINLKAFWLRRARRLLPALYLLLVATLTYSVIFLPNEVAGLRSDALAAFSYVTNWYLVFGHKSYFETVGRPPLLQHLWSLAVEEQFYLLWPLLFSGLMKVLRPKPLFFALLVGVALSVGLMVMLYLPDVDPSRLYYGTDTRAAGLLLGATLAFGYLPSQPPNKKGWVKGRISPRLLDLVGLVALGGLIWFFVEMSQFDPFLYQGGLTVVSLLSVAVIAVVIQPNTLLGSRLLGWGPLRWIGLRSYGIYLWHWPIFMLTRPQLDLPLDGWALLALRLGLTGVVVELSYRYIETPFRRGTFGRRWKSSGRWQRRGFAALLVLFGGTLSVALWSVTPPVPPPYLAVGSISDSVVPTAVATTLAPTASAIPPTEVINVSETATATLILAYTPTPNLTLSSSESVVNKGIEIPTESVSTEVAVSPSLAVVIAPTLDPASIPLSLTPDANASLPTGINEVLTFTPTPELTHLPISEPSPAPAFTLGLPAAGEAIVSTLTSVPTETPKLEVTLGLPAGEVIAPTPTPELTATLTPTPEPTSVLATLTPEPTSILATLTPEPTSILPAPTPTTPNPTAVEVSPATATPNLTAIEVSPTPNPTPLPTEAPLVRVFAIGDSVMLGAAKELKQAMGGLDMEASVGLQVSTALNHLRTRRDAGGLGEVVVVHLGNNGTFSATQFDQIMELLSSVRRVVFVNVKVPRPWEKSNNQVLEAGVKRYKNTYLLDWHSLSVNRPELFWDDGIHLRPAGAKFYSDNILALLN